MTALRYGCRGTRATFRNKGVCERPPLVKTGRRPSVLRGGIKFRFDYRAQVATSETLPPRKGSFDGDPQAKLHQNVGQMRGRGGHSRPARNSWPSFKPDCLSPAGHKVLVLALRKARHWMLGARLNPAVRVRRASRRHGGSLDARRRGATEQDLSRHWSPLAPRYSNGHCEREQR